jgi:hypothetical protein
MKIETPRLMFVTRKKKINWFKLPKGIYMGWDQKGQSGEGYQT